MALEQFLHKRQRTVDGHDLHGVVVVLEERLQQGDSEVLGERLLDGVSQDR